VIDAVTPGSGNIIGSTCSSCTVEVFQNSDTDGEGEVYIGTAPANASGDFSLVLPSLSYPYLTATATDARGTSEFSDVFTSELIFMYLPLLFGQ
jgi:hypothetical protein